MLQKLREELSYHLSSSGNRRVLVGVSGGADSVALLRALRDLQDEMQFETVVAHFDHQTRDGQSRKEAQWVESLSKQLQLDCYLGSAPAIENHSEEALRELRLRFLIETADRLQAALICLAHHADDQIETILHHLVRGSGLQGMLGIPANRTVAPGIVLLHPMLTIRKSEILDYLDSIGQEFCVDVSNHDLRYTRNRIRHQLIPMLNELNSQTGTHLLQLRQQVAETYDYLRFNAELLLKDCLISAENDLVRLNAKILKISSELMRRELFRLVWTNQQWPRKKMTCSHWVKLAQFVINDQTEIHLPAGISVQKRGEMIAIERSPAS